MRADEFGEAVTDLVRDLEACGVSFLVLEDGNPLSVTVVAGPAQRNLERLVRALKRMQASGGRPAQRRIDYDALVHGGPRRVPLRAGGLPVELVLVDVADGRWSAYYEEAEPVELAPGLWVDVVPDAPILRMRRAAASDVRPDLGLTQRERDRLREDRRRSV
ncbi:MAG: hypothetical protein JWM31_2530, partial [Solirubrobacterales bacterium]|nr:hypothetical protein [Solirubrobacterales bacterium]